MLEVFHENEKYYIISYSYIPKNSGDAIYTPMGFEKETIYECSEDTFNQLKNSQ